MGPPRPPGCTPVSAPVAALGHDVSAEPVFRPFRPAWDWADLADSSAHGDGDINNHDDSGHADKHGCANASPPTAEIHLRADTAAATQPAGLRDGVRPIVNHTSDALGPLQPETAIGAYWIFRDRLEELAPARSRVVGDAVLELLSDGLECSDGDASIEKLVDRPGLFDLPTAQKVATLFSGVLRIMGMLAGPLATFESDGPRVLQENLQQVWTARAPTRPARRRPAR